jgi:hypothetical protein
VQDPWAELEELLELDEDLLLELDEDLLLELDEDLLLELDEGLLLELDEDLLLELDEDLLLELDEDLLLELDEDLLLELEEELPLDSASCIRLDTDRVRGLKRRDWCFQAVFPHPTSVGSSAPDAIGCFGSTRPLWDSAVLEATTAFLSLDFTPSRSFGIAFTFGSLGASTLPLLQF